MQVTVGKPSESSVRSIKSQMEKAAKGAIADIVRKNPRLKEAFVEDIKVDVKDYPQMTSTVGEEQLSFTVKLNFSLPRAR